MKRIIFIVATLVVCLQVMATTRYVNVIAAGTADGSTWSNASADIQVMIDSSAYGDTIWVAAGIYLPTRDINDSLNPVDLRTKTFFLKSGVKIFGGFTGTETLLSQRTLSVMVNNPSVLSGDIGVQHDTSDNCYHVVFAAYCDSTTAIDGFTIRDGQADGVGFQFVNSTSVSYAWGGGMMAEYAPVTITNCLFLYNHTASLGGGLFTSKSSVTITGCVFAYNTSVDQGGGWDNEFVSTSNISNSIFYGNRATTGGGILSEIGAVLNVTNCTFNHNTASSAGGGLNADSSTLKNCIVWGNTPAPYIIRASYSIIEGPSVFAGTGNINAPAGFINDTLPAGPDSLWRTADDGLQILPCSPAVDMGTAGNVPPQDILGNNRYDVPGTGIWIVDMGAYENQENKTIASFTIQGDTLTADSAGRSYQWITCPANTAAPGNSTGQTYIVSVNGTYQLVITDGACNDTSACTQIGPSGIATVMAASEGLVVYPNPASSEIRIIGGQANEDRLTIYDLAGQVLRQQKYVTGAVIDINDLAPGMYIIAVGGETVKLGIDGIK